MGLVSFVNNRGRSLSAFGLKLGVAVLALAFLGQEAKAQVVQAFGNIYPADNPFTLDIDEGLPVGGNTIRLSEEVDHQTYFEGSHSPGTDLFDPEDDTNVNYNVFVGKDAFSAGTLRLANGAALRDMHLIIGDAARATGTMIIEGNGSLYNNDPLIIPPGLPSNFSSVAPRITADPMDGLEAYAEEEDGFDLYVGRSGNGTLRILAGGRAEINDAVVIGDQAGSTGVLLVDGVGSTLSNGSINAQAQVIFEPHQMLVGRLGVGTMTISNGGLVLSEAPQALGGDATLAAVIGGNPYNEDDLVPDPGGRGSVILMGADSRWILGGSLQIGGFNFGDDGGVRDVEGELALYNSEAGKGSLYVGEGTLVDMVPQQDAIEDDELFLVIGRFGILDMAGGLVTMSNAVNVGGEDQGSTDDLMLLNDGIIRGKGRIETGVFRNRFLGEVRVGPNERLTITSSSEFDLVAPDEEPLGNWGLIQVMGTSEQRAELEFERAPDTFEDPVRPFRNLFVPNAPPGAGRSVGQITAAHSTLRFRSGLSNGGKLSFIAGDNFVSGRVVNEAGDDANGIPSGEISVSGNSTTVTFEHALENNGRFYSFPNTSLVLFENDFTQGPTGVMQLSLGSNSSSSFNTSYLSIMGDAALDGTLQVELQQNGTSFNPQAGDEFQILEAMGTLSGIFTSFIAPAGLAPGLVMFPEYDYILGTVTLVVDAGLPAGPDFNNDGVIDGADFDIWFNNQGILAGATTQQGDADGDGDVDLDDFFFWQRNVGQPPPWSGSGAGSGSGGGFAVPEPSGIVLLLMGSMLSAISRRRRTR